MILKVKPLQGEDITVEVEPTDQILTIKQKLEETQGVPVVQQRLIYQGQKLKNIKTIESYRLRNGSTIEYVVALRSA